MVALSPIPEMEQIIADAGRLKVLRARSSAPLRVDKREILAILARLGEAKITIEILRETSVGVEVNRPHIRQHLQQDICDQSAALTAKWKELVLGKPVVSPVRTLQPQLSGAASDTQSLDGEPVSGSLSVADGASAYQNAIDEPSDGLAKQADAGIIPAAEYMAKQKALFARFTHKLEKQEAREHKREQREERRMKDRKRASAKMRERKNGVKQDKDKRKSSHDHKHEKQKKR